MIRCKGHARKKEAVKSAAWDIYKAGNTSLGNQSGALHGFGA
jgi:hypothetical protein